MFQVEDSHELRILDNEKHNHADFEVDATNYDASKEYGCENDHSGVKAAILSHSTSFNPKTGDFDLAGTIVYVCPRCEKPVMDLNDL